MDCSSTSATDSDGSKIAALREAWLAAVKASDADSLAQMLTDDVVVVHGNGRCVCGKEAVKADFLEGFGRFAISQKVSASEVIVRGNNRGALTTIRCLLESLSCAGFVGLVDCLHV